MRAAAQNGTALLFLAGSYALSLAKQLRVLLLQQRLQLRVLLLLQRASMRAAAQNGTALLFLARVLTQCGVSSGAATRPAVAAVAAARPSAVATVSSGGAYAFSCGEGFL